MYRVYDLILNQAVALKFLGRAGMSEAAQARCRSEVRIARQVSHPNVCGVYDIGFLEGSDFISMEYLDGEDLASLIRRIGRLPQDKAIEFARKICAGLAAAHERGVLHRDLKPGNIMIDGRREVRITDFGLGSCDRRHAQQHPPGIRSRTSARSADFAARRSWVCDSSASAGSIMRSAFSTPCRNGGRRMEFTGGSGTSGLRRLERHCEASRRPRA